MTNLWDMSIVVFTFGIQDRLQLRYGVDSGSLLKTVKGPVEIYSTVIWWMAIMSQLLFFMKLTLSRMLKF